MTDQPDSGYRGSKRFRNSGKQSYNPSLVLGTRVCFHVSRRIRFQTISKQKLEQLMECRVISILLLFYDRIEQYRSETRWSEYQSLQHFCRLQSIARSTCVGYVNKIGSVIKRNKVYTRLSYTIGCRNETIP